MSDIHTERAANANCVLGFFLIFFSRRIEDVAMAKVWLITGSGNGLGGDIGERAGRRRQACTGSRADGGTGTTLWAAL